MLGHLVQSLRISVRSNQMRLRNRATPRRTGPVIPGIGSAVERSGTDGQDPARA